MAFLGLIGSACAYLVHESTISKIGLTQENPLTCHDFHKSKNQLGLWVDLVLLQDQGQHDLHGSHLEHELRHKTDTNPCRIGESIHGENVHAELVDELLGVLVLVDILLLLAMSIAARLIL